MGWQQAGGRPLFFRRDSNAGAALSVTATSRPPLVWGSARMLR